MREINTGKKQSEETKAKISKSITGSGNGMYGKHHSDSSKEKMAQMHKKPICQYSFDGELIREWDSAEDASKNTGISRSNICACCNGKTKTSHGYIWKFKDDKIDMKYLEWQILGNRRPVIQYSKNGVFIKKYKSIKEAANENGIDASRIVSCCKGKKEMYHGYKWRYGNIDIPNVCA